MRLDTWLVQNGKYSSRNKAQDAIKEGLVSVGGSVINKAAHEVGEELVEVEESDVYVSRAGLKLKAFLQSNPLPLSGKRCLDIGSSTGGFSQVLLEQGVKTVTAVDVGKDQFARELRKDSRVSLYEETDIRDFKTEQTFPVVSCDVSFISLHHILQSIDKLAADIIILLFKPQFEVGRDAKRNKSGIVLDTQAVDSSRKTFENACSELNWTLIKCEESQVLGKEGNREYFYLYRQNTD